MLSEHWIRLISETQVEPYNVVGFTPGTPCTAMHLGEVEPGRYCERCSKVHTPLEIKLARERSIAIWHAAKHESDNRAGITQRADKQKRRVKKRHALKIFVPA